jgi:protein gp37
MASSTAIEWTDATWNPITGCTKISAGCDNCYATRFSERFRGVPGHPFATGFDLTLRPERLLQPLGWKTPRMIFVNSMSDLFHKEIPKTYITSVFDTMERANWHIYQVLTKRSSLLQKFINERYKTRPAPAHIWLGVSVENQQATSRIAHLQKANASIRFLSVEPLISPVGKLNLKGIDWVIVGGESGPRARPMDARWAIDVRNQCSKAKVAFFFKQWGGRSPKSGGRLLEGREWNEFPATLPTIPSQRSEKAKVAA